VFFDGTPVRIIGAGTRRSAPASPASGAEHTLALGVVDRESLSQPRGKQWHRRNPSAPSTAGRPRSGNPVWLEALPRTAAIVDLRVDSTRLAAR